MTITSPRRGQFRDLFRVAAAAFDNIDPRMDDDTLYSLTLQLLQQVSFDFPACELAAAIAVFTRRERLDAEARTEEAKA